jgi:hypothetical protein
MPLNKSRKKQQIHLLHSRFWPHQCSTNNFWNIHTYVVTKYNFIVFNQYLREYNTQARETYTDAKIQNYHIWSPRNASVLPCPVCCDWILVFQSSSTLWRGIYTRLGKLLKFNHVYLAIRQTYRFVWSVGLHIWRK